MSLPADIPALNERPVKNTICLFDVDGTLTPARQQISPSMSNLLHTLRQHVPIGFVGGSDLPKQQEQLSPSVTIPVTSLFDYCFSENGLTAFKLGEAMANTSFIQWIGETKYQSLVRFLLHYIADLDIPVKRGTFVEFRRGMVNVSPIGRNASLLERVAFEEYDKVHNVRAKFIEALKREFPDLGLTYSIGGQLSFDVFPTGWDKTYCLQHLERDAKLPGGVEFTTVHFFGDKTHKGGNDFEIFEDPRTVGHAVNGPEETEALIRKLFDL